MSEQSVADEDDELSAADHIAKAQDFLADADYAAVAAHAIMAVALMQASSVVRGRRRSDRVGLSR